MDVSEKKGSNEVLSIKIGLNRMNQLSPTNQTIMILLMIVI